MISPALAGYLAASRVAGPIAGWLVRRRAARGREDLGRLGERLGEARFARPAGRLVWLHAASVGEAQSVLPLISEIRDQAPETSCLVTTVTVTSARRMAELLPKSCIHQFAPIDTAVAVRGFLDHWRPDLAIWVESEFWPGLMTATARCGTPMMLVNARISARSARRWGWVPGMASTLVRSFSRIVTQDKATVDRLVAMGANLKCVREGGNLKAITPVPDCDAVELARLSELLAGRPVWLAASTHAPEENAVVAAHQDVARSSPELLTILAPRHPERGNEIAALLTGKGLSVARRSLGEVPDDETDVWLADTIGEMGLWFRLAPVTFIGGSIAKLGGHNPFEPGALGSAILHGPEISNFAPAYAALDVANGARMVADGSEIGKAVSTLFGDAVAHGAMIEAAKSVRKRLEPDVATLAGEALELIEGVA
jgi:3-deoxy-D-manno-octulosonic-acid transferase